jgi:lipopolysaccharide/colanic/teichoic acid biosynthesis glycosyltransferase
MKRLFDIIVSFTGLVLMAPLMALIAGAIKLSSAGPVFFTGGRVGLNERPFRVIKFRTMVRDAVKLGSSVTTSRDPRITPLGHFLRRMKLDELPQLINVLAGEMSIVGPRPEVPEIVRNYTIDMRNIFRIKPGITSVATLRFKDEERLLAGMVDPDFYYESQLVPIKVKLAMEHVSKGSLWFDMGVFLRTLVALARL